MLLHRLDDLIPVVAALLQAHLVGLQRLADQLVGHRVRAGAGRRGPEPDQLPLAGGRVPLDPAVLGRGAQVDHTGRIDVPLRRHRQQGEIDEALELGAGAAPAAIDDRVRPRDLHAHPLAALDGHRAGDDLLHVPLLVDPRAAGGRVADRIVQPDLQAQPLGFRRGVFHRVPVLRAAVGLIGPGIVEGRLVRLLDGGGEVENRRPADAGRLHGFEILGDAFLREVRAHPMPPDVGAGGDRRIAEGVFQRGFGGGQRGTQAEEGERDGFHRGWPITPREIDLIQPFADFPQMPRHRAAPGRGGKDGRLRAAGPAGG